MKDATFELQEFELTSFPLVESLQHSIAQRIRNCNAENASKVVDENGEPLVVYHGTPNGGFVEFDRKRIGSNSGVGRNAFRL